MKFANSYDKSIIRICIDSRPGGGMAGRIAAVYLPEELTFCDAGEMLLLIEAYLDATGQPQAFQRGRTFGSKRIVEVSEELNESALTATGRLGTCSLRVSTRQNATWQGYADVDGSGNSEFFASALELVYLLDSRISK